MGFFMLYWKRYSLLCWLAASLLVLAPARAADGIVIRSAEMRQVDGEYLLYARLSISLTPMLTDALNRGINLYFDTDFDFSLPRWYWFPQQLAHLSRVTRLSYNILLRQYFVSGINVEARSMSTLPEALDYLGEINGWLYVGPVPHGSSFIQVVSFTGNGCPDARTILTYSQSTNPKDPHFADQTRLFSRGGWVTDRFCEPDVAKATLSTVRLRG